MQGKQNLGMGDQPARKFFVDLRRRNEFDEWGLELRGGWRGGDTWVEVAYVRRDTPADLAGIRQPQLVFLSSSTSFFYFFSSLFRSFSISYCI